MLKKNLKFGFLLLFLLILHIVTVEAIIRNGSCLATETCLLSMFEQNNSHVGECDYYNHSLCYSSVKTVNLIEGSCSSGEVCMLSQWQQNNSHVGECDYYNYSLCISGDWNIALYSGSCSGTPMMTFFQHNNSHVGNLNYYNYTLCLEEIIPSGGGGPSGGGVSGRSIREVIHECTTNDDCRKDYVCNKYNCVKLFDIKILEVDSPISPKGFFSFTYFIKGMADFNNDVVVEFWLDKAGERITYGHDTIYLGSFEEKTDKTKLYLPADVSSGLYRFRIQVSYMDYVASSSRLIEINGKEVELKKENYLHLDTILFILAGGLLVGCFIYLYWLIRHKIKWKRVIIIKGDRFDLKKLP